MIALEAGVQQGTEFLKQGLEAEMVEERVLAAGTR